MLGRFFYSATESETNTTVLQFAITSLAVLVMILTIAAITAFVKLHSGKPPKAYRIIMENAPCTIIEQHKRSKKRCDVRAVVSISFLIASQVLKLSYFVCIWLGLEEIE